MLQHFFQALTAEIGSVLELKDVDKGIDDYRSTPHLTFDQYRYYLSKEESNFFFYCFTSFGGFTIMGRGDLFHSIFQTLNEHIWPERLLPQRS